MCKHMHSVRGDRSTCKASSSQGKEVLSRAKGLHVTCVFKKRFNLQVVNSTGNFCPVSDVTMLFYLPVEKRSDKTNSDILHLKTVLAN